MHACTPRQPVRCGCAPCEACAWLAAVQLNLQQKEALDAKAEVHQALQRQQGERIRIRAGGNAAMASGAVRCQAHTQLVLDGISIQLGTRWGRP